MKKVIKIRKITFVIIGLFIILIDYTFVENSIFHHKSFNPKECNKGLSHLEHFHSDFFENKVHFINSVGSIEKTHAEWFNPNKIELLNNNFSLIWQPPKIS